jgi:predicted transcriptional regulator
MAVLWRTPAATVADVVEALRERYALTYSTVQTMLRILEQKGYVTHDKSGRAFIFRAVVDKGQARRQALKHLIGRLFDGSPSLLVSNVLDDEEIDPQEVEQLKRLIEQV